MSKPRVIFFKEKLYETSYGTRAFAFYVMNDGSAWMELMRPIDEEKDKDLPDFSFQEESNFTKDEDKLGLLVGVAHVFKCNSMTHTCICVSNETLTNLNEFMDEYRQTLIPPAEA